MRDEPVRVRYSTRPRPALLVCRLQYKELEPVAFGRVVKSKRVLDGLNALDMDTWVAAGWTCRALGGRAC